MFNGLDKVRLGAGASSSTIHPLILGWMIIAVILTFILPRRHVIVPLLISLFFVPFGQQIYVGGVHLFATRVVILSGLIRVFGTKLPNGFTGIDKLFAMWAAFRVTATLLLFPQLQAVINQGGFVWDAVGGYFLFRQLLRSKEDVLYTVKLLAVFVAILGATMTGERLTGHNVFGLIGGVWLSQVRDGSLRSQGSFQGPIPAGTFAATLVCLFAWLLREKGSRVMAIVGMAGAAVMIFTSASSTPLLTIAAAGVGLAFWPLRNHMRLMRWGAVLALAALQLVMKAPVWMIINHISLVGGNSAYHRAMLVDQFIRHFEDWWLIGVKSTALWGWDMWDQANQFAWEGESGGLLTFICFVLFITRSFGLLGKARKMAAVQGRSEWPFWAFGSALFAFVVAFFGISLADQLQYGWYALLAMIGAIAWPVLAATPAASEPILMEEQTVPSLTADARETQDVVSAWMAQQRR